MLPAEHTSVVTKDAKTRAVPQLPLALRYPPDQRFDRFLQSPAGLLEQLNALATGQVHAPVYLQGGAATGKTHLLLAACAAAEAAGRRPAYLSLKGLGGRVREACEGLEQADLVVLDALDAVLGTREAEVALFDLHNRLHDHRRGLLYAAAGAPDGLSLCLPDLRSRLMQCTRWRLSPLNDEGRAELLRQRAAARGLDFEAPALEWMLRRCCRDLGSLTALFETLDHASLAAQRRLTVPFLRQVLGTD